METVLIFVSADIDLLSVAEAEELDIQDPNAYSPTPPNGRAKAGPYRRIRPAEAGGGCYRYPPCEWGWTCENDFMRS